MGLLILLQLLFIVKFFVSNVKRKLIISSYLVFVFMWTGGRTVSVPEPEYSVQGYASAMVQCHLVQGCWNLTMM